MALNTDTECVVLRRCWWGFVEMGCCTDEMYGGAKIYSGSSGS